MMSGCGLTLLMAATGAVGKSTGARAASAIPVRV